ncbi:MAG: FtsQ-type POTRA domain-containing protein [Oligoflexia bacterium]|nr:FtsQ-type POTRA domain-containing protein [Oligoflexia bacterium]
MKSKASKTFLFVGIPAAFSIVIFIFLLIEIKHYFLTSEHFSVRVVEVLTEGPSTKEAVISLASIPKQANIFSLDLEEVKKRIEKDPWVRSAIVSRVLPDKIQIRYRSQEPVALLGMGDLFYVNDEGVAFYQIKEGDSLNYPLIQVEVKKPSLEELKDDIQGALSLLKVLNANNAFSMDDLGEISLQNAEKNAGVTYLLTLAFPPKHLRPKKGAHRSVTYTVSLAKSDYDSQIKRWSAVVRYVLKHSKIPKLIRLELGKKVVVKVGS